MMRTGSLIKRKATDAPYKSKSSSKRIKSSSKTGRVGAKSTTLASSPTPFPPTKFVTFDYSNGLYLRIPVSNTDVIPFAPNDMFDFDRSTGFLGNKQPLYFDALLSSNGPYRFFKVISWVTEFTVINRGAAPITLWLTNAQLAADIDTVTEVDNLPGVVKKFVDVTGGMSMVTIKHTGNLKDTAASYTVDITNSGTYSSSPSNSVQGSLVLYSSSALNYEVAVKHRAYTQLLVLDAQAS